ncbi:MAG: hypothetical protein Kow0077_23870 [Anaerolineae bacterium]
MIEQADRRALALAALDEAVNEAAAYFQAVSGNVFDGYQTAHEVLVHLVYLHCAHLEIARALVAGNTPPLLDGSPEVLNRCAQDALRGQTGPDLVAQLQAQQAALAELLPLLDWASPFPLKRGGLPVMVEERVCGLAAHIHQHVAQLRRARAAYRLGPVLN